MSAVWLTKGFQYTPDLDGYFNRIKYFGSREISAQTLKEIQCHHLLAIPFEALDVHLIGDIDLAPEVLEKKIVGNNRGGYCYENNILAFHVLRTMGFDVTPVAARTRWQKPVEVVMPSTHMVLKVNIDGVLWMFDVGFSSFGSLYPLEIETEREQSTPLGILTIQLILS
jgi:N-hydroxyarylamine O-acetyltransferase